MAITRLGWDVFTTSSNKRLTNFPWITGRVRAGDAYTVLDELARRFNDNVEPIIRAHSWGWAYRPVRGATVLSEHSAGTAVDFNAPAHPLGRSGTFTAAEVREIRKILTYLDGAVRWGGDYSGRKDEMHFELRGGVKKLEAVADKIKRDRAGKGSTPKPAPKPKPPTNKKDTGGRGKDDPNTYKVRSESSIRSVCLRAGLGTEKNSTPHLIGLYQRAQISPYPLYHDQIWGSVTDKHFRWVGQLQKHLNEWKGTKIPVSGVFDRTTRNRLVEWQKRNMGGAYKGTIADGVAGPLTVSPLGIKRYPN